MYRYLPRGIEHYYLRSTLQATPGHVRFIMADKQAELKELASSLIGELRAEIRGSNPHHDDPQTSNARQMRGTSSRGTHGAFRPPSLFSTIKGKKKKVREEKMFTRDFMLLPRDSADAYGRVKVPRGSSRNALIGSGLIGKVQLRPSMTELEVRRELCSIFADPLGIENSEHITGREFEYLQSSGEGTCSLHVPKTSKSFEWTGQEVINLSKQGRSIYLLAQKAGITVSDVQQSSSDQPLVTLPILLDSEPSSDDNLPLVKSTRMTSGPTASKPSYIEMLEDFPSPLQSSDDEMLQTVLQESLEASCEHSLEESSM